MKAVICDGCRDAAERPTATGRLRLQDRNGELRKVKRRRKCAEPSLQGKFKVEKE